MRFRDKGADSSKNLLRLKDGESIRGVFRGEIYEFRQHWMNDRSVLCTGSNTCKPCQDKNKSAFRFRLNFIVKENDVFIAKIVEQGWKVYEQLRSLNEDYDLEKHMIKISRQGSGLSDTTYMVTPVPNGALSAEQEEKIKALKLNPLAHEDLLQEPPSDPNVESDVPW